ncbi:MAG: endopeptidase [Planctomycetes bacterium]|nr:endopeptidase [Planctomycetota bacterium]
MNEPNPFDLAEQEAAENALTEEAKLERLVEVDDFKFVMEDKRGRRMLWRLLAETGVFRLSFTGDMATTNFKEGSRNIGLKYLALIHEVCPETYALMLKEHREYGRRKRNSR